ncbi:MAG TPA: hypothetical protein VHM20_01985, partial [Gammaproteobacteria bacterium]|nr:hypothetical protein [Gammaproteobacteria bacterium]
AHELTHVVQQQKGTSGVGTENDQEEEADKNSKLAVTGSNAKVSNGAKNSVQKKDQEVKNTTAKVEHGDSRIENGKTEYWDAEFDNGANKPKGKWVTLDHTNSQIVSNFITKHYGVRPRELERFWFENKSLRDNLSKQGDPVLNYTIFVMEGGGDAVTNFGINYNDAANPMSSYANFGLDFVASEFPNLVKGNFLPADFVKKYNLKIEGTHNEKYHGTIAYYSYPNFESAARAMGAYVGYSTSKILELSKNLGIEAPTNDEKIFWTYLYFNNPKSYANKFELKNRGGYQLNKWTFDDLKNIEYKCTHDALSINIDTMALMRVSTYKYFKIRFNDKARYK